MPADLVEITDNVIDGLVARPEVLAAFPFLQRFATARKAAECKRCGRKRLNRVAYDQAKSSLVHMGQADKHRLLGFLDANQARVELLVRGQPHRVTIGR